LTEDCEWWRSEALRLRAEISALVGMQIRLVVQNQALSRGDGGSSDDE